MSKKETIFTAEEVYMSLLSTLPLTIEKTERTPQRAAKAFREMTIGYHMDVDEVIGKGIFPYNGNSIVHVKGLEICSTCEHHLLPFIGTCSITYIPDKQIFGLSKLKRIVDVYAKRLQVQERLYEQIADVVEKYIKAKGVLVVIRCLHMCMKMRGICEFNPETTTTATRGEFIKNETLRVQYYNDSNSNEKI